MDIAGRGEVQTVVLGFGELITSQFWNGQPSIGTDAHCKTNGLKPSTFKPPKSLTVQDVRSAMTLSSHQPRNLTVCMIATEALCGRLWHTVPLALCPCRHLCIQHSE